MNGFIRKVVGVTMTLTSALLLNTTGAFADTVPFSGSASVEVPASPAGDMGFTLEVNGQEHDFSNVDNSLGGRLTLTWVGSETEPQATIQDCGEGAPGGQIRLDETTPSAKLYATWVSPTSQETFGPVELPSREGFAAASVCVPESRDPDEPAEDPGDDPAVEDPGTGGDPGAQDPGSEEQPDEHGKPKKDKDKDKKAKP